MMDALQNGAANQSAYKRGDDTKRVSQAHGPEIYEMKCCYINRKHRSQTTSLTSQNRVLDIGMF